MSSNNFWPVSGNTNMQLMCYSLCAGLVIIFSLFHYSFYFIIKSYFNAYEKCSLMSIFCLYLVTNSSFHYCVPIQSQFFQLILLCAYHAWGIVPAMGVLVNKRGFVFLKLTC